MHNKTSSPRLVCFIPARSGSKRIKNKNIRELNGHPLMAYTIAAAISSNCFDRVIVCTDSSDYAAIALRYGAEVPFLRNVKSSQDGSPDIEWLTDAVAQLKAENYNFDGYAILRPTNPFRTVEAIKRAYRSFVSSPEFDSLRAVSICNEHPAKMWVIEGDQLFPIFPFKTNMVPWHSNQKHKLPIVYVQNASLEIGWKTNVTEKKSISGEKIKAFKSLDYEGFDLNEPHDWIVMETLLLNGLAQLPSLEMD